MEIYNKDIEGVKVFAPKIFKDERGYFLETFRKNFFENLGLPEFVQHNHSRSRRGVLWGLHYQLKNVQGKLVSCLRGEIFDVAVDIRTKSKTFGKSVITIIFALKLKFSDLDTPAINTWSPISKNSTS